MNFLKGIGSGGAQKLPDDDNVEKKGSGFLDKMKNIGKSKTDGLLSGATEHDEETIVKDPSAAKTKQMSQKIGDHGKSSASTSTPKEVKHTPEGHSKVAATAAGPLGMKKSPSTDTSSTGSTLSSYGVGDDDEEENIQVNLKQHAGKTEETHESTRETIRKNTPAPEIGGNLYDKFGRLNLLVKTNDAKTLTEIKTNFVQYIDQYLKFADARMTELSKKRVSESIRDIYEGYWTKIRNDPGVLTSAEVRGIITNVNNYIERAGGARTFDSAEDREIIESLSKNGNSWIKAMTDIENRIK